MCRGPVFVLWGRWDRAPQTGRLVNNRPLFLAAVEPKKSKTKMLALSGGGLLCVLTVVVGCLCSSSQGTNPIHEGTALGT